jgi:hypothetical protein
MFEIQCGPESSAVGSGRPRVDEANVCGHHQQAMHQSQRASFLLLPTLAKQVSRTRDGVHPEQPDDSATNGGMNSALRSGWRRLVEERLTQHQFRGEEWHVATLAYL